MTVFIDSYPGGRGTAQAIASCMDDAVVRHPAAHRVDINWGRNRAYSEHVLNRMAPITKAAAFTKFADAGVSIPEVREIPAGFIVRSKGTHNRGRDIQTENDCMLVRQINKLQEVRVDVYRLGDGYKAFRLHKKIPHNPDDLIWNRENTEWQSFGSRTMVGALGGDREPISLAKKALQALDYDFGAVDIVQGPHRGAWYVLEVNSAPRLGPAGAAAYATRFQRMVDHAAP